MLLTLVAFLLCFHVALAGDRRTHYENKEDYNTYGSSLHRGCQLVIESVFVGMAAAYIGYKAGEVDARLIEAIVLNNAGRKRGYSMFTEADALIESVK